MTLLTITRVLLLLISGIGTIYAVLFFTNKIVPPNQKIIITLAYTMLPAAFAAVSGDTWSNMLLGGCFGLLLMLVITADKWIPALIEKLKN